MQSDHYFSPSTGGFYAAAIHGPRLIATPQTERERKAGKRPAMISNPDCRIPDDAVPISARRHAELLAEAGKGRRIVADGDGSPIAVDQASAPGQETWREARRRRRDRALRDSDWTQLPDTLDTELTAAWADYRQQLRDLDLDGEGWPVEPERTS